MVYYAAFVEKPFIFGNRKCLLLRSYFSNLAGRRFQSCKAKANLLRTPLPKIQFFTM